MRPSTANSRCFDAPSLWPTLNSRASPSLSRTTSEKVFLTPEQYVLLVSKQKEHIKPVFQFAYRTGSRRGQILNLKWPSVDLPNAVVRLEPGETKSGDGRTIPLTSDLVSMLEALPRESDFVFTYRGKPIKGIKAAWKSACEAAGMPDLLFHDLRRTGVRNLVRAGVSEHVAMSVSGHKTRAVFDRYNIVSEADQRDAVAKLEAAQSTLERQAENMLPGKMDSFMVSTKTVEEATKVMKPGRTKKSIAKPSAPQVDEQPE